MWITQGKGVKITAEMAHISSESRQKNGQNEVSVMGVLEVSPPPFRFGWTHCMPT